MSQARARAWDLMFSIYEVNTDSLPKASISVFTLLVGVCYCLWRTAFLLKPNAKDQLSPGSRDWRKVGLIDARKLLAEMLEHNRVNYPEEVSLRVWFAGFYLNSAHQRINRIIDKYKLPSGEVAQDPWGAMNVNEPDWERWNFLLELSERIVREFKEKMQRR